MLVQCEVLQELLTDGWNFDTLVIEKAPLLDILMAPENRNGISTVVSPGQGKLLDAKMTYFQRLTTAGNEEGTGWDCNATQKIGNLSYTYTMNSDDYIVRSALIEEADMDRVCMDNGVYFATVVAQLVDAVRRGVWEKSATESVALTGKWAADVTPVDGQDDLIIKTLVGATFDRPAPFAYEQIELATQMTSYPKPGVILSDKLLYEYMRRIAAGCCQDTGVNLQDMLNTYGMPTMYDRAVVAAFGGAAARRSLVFSLGALQLLTHTTTPWRDNIRPEIRSSAGYFTTVIFDSSGVPYDLRVVDNCGLGISIFVKATTKVVALPSDMFSTGDNLAGVNFVNSVEVVN